MPIKWEQATMATGIPTVDAQHRQLIDWLNDLLAAMSQGQGRNQVSSVLDKLDKYVETHFAHEEDCMVKYHCSVAAANIAAHAYFVNAFAEMRAEYEAKGASSHLVMRVETELAQWFANHIKGVDAQLGPCVRSAAA